jgi:hypothetical protein
MITVRAGTAIHCNRCDKSFTLNVDVKRGPFCGSRAARLTEFSHCPHCGMSDSHWLYATDAGMPVFPGGPDARKRAERNWLGVN